MVGLFSVLCKWGSLFCGSCALVSKGGLHSLRHNEIRDLTAILLKCAPRCALNQNCNLSNNPGEFHLSTSNTQEGAHLDIVINSFEVVILC